MKVLIGRDGYIKIVAESIVEAFALKCIAPATDDICSTCGQAKINIIIDINILNIDKPAPI